MLQKIFGIDEGTLFFTTMLHIGTLISVIVIFRKDIWAIIRDPFNRLTMLLAAATIPTVIIVLVLKDAVEEAFRSASTLGFGFIITGLVLWAVESLKPGQKALDQMNWKDAAFIGVAQGFAVFPAISRSGSTIAGALFQKFDRRFAARFSFLMSIPAILGSVVFQVKDIIGTGMISDLFPVAVGTIAAAISGFIAIKFMLEIIAKRSLKIFSIYVFVLGGFVLLDQMILHIFIK